MKSIGKFNTKEIKNSIAIKGGKELHELSEQLVNMTVKDVKEL